MSPKDEQCKEEMSKEEKCKNLPPSIAQKKSLPKPIMRNIHRTRSLNNVYKAVAFAGSMSLLFYIFWNRRRMSIYSDFYRNYDAEESFNRMVKAGVLVSAPAPKK